MYEVMSARAQLRATERELAAGPAPGETFSENELDGLDEPVRRYFASAIEPGTPLWPSARVTMRGSIRLGRWLPFRATEMLAPRSGFLWRARVAGLVSGFDRYIDGVGEMAWRLAGLVPVMRASGADVSRSAAARAGGEGSGCRRRCWVASAPTGTRSTTPRSWDASRSTTHRSSSTIESTSTER